MGAGQNSSLSRQAEAIIARSLSVEALLPELVAASAGMDAAQSQDVFGAERAPEHARLFAARADHGLAAGLDDSGTDEQALPAKGPVLHSLDIEALGSYLVIVICHLALRAYTEGPARQGVVEPPWQGLVGGVVLGTVGFAEKLRQHVRGNPREQKPLRAPGHAASWEQIVAALERSKGESWNEFAERHGDWGRDAALWLRRCAGRLRLAELGRLAGNLDYAVVSKAIARFEQRKRTEPQLRQRLASVQLRLPK